MSLHNYQKVTRDFILENEYCLICLDLGMGKTLSTLSALSTMDFNKCLVIAPLRVAQSTWTDEIAKWGFNFRVSLILGDAQKRIDALHADADIYIINRENVCWLVDQYSKLPFDIVVIDEISSFKSAQAKRFKALKKVRHSIKRLVGLTGTPAPNSLLDLWPQVYLLDMGKRLGKYEGGYKQRYFLPDRMGPNQIVYSWKLRENAEENIYNQINDICISMKATDYLDMPDRIDNKIYIQFSASLQKKYDYLEENSILKFINSDAVAGSAAILTNKLLQFASGAIYDENNNVQYIHDLKLDALEELVEHANGKSVLVFYNYKHDLTRLQARFKKAVVLKTVDHIKAWNAGNIKLLFVHPGSCGHGLNLQDGGNIIVWFSLTWSLELYQQANARLYRQGQKNTVVINHIIAKGTVDELVMKALEKKDMNQEALLQAIKVKYRGNKVDGLFSATIK